MSNMQTDAMQDNHIRINCLATSANLRRLEDMSISTPPTIHVDKCDPEFFYQKFKQVSDDDRVEGTQYGRRIRLLITIC